MSDVFERTVTDKIEGESKNDRTIEHVRRFMEKSREYRKPHVDLALKSREMYECWSAQAKSTIQRANLKLPYAYSIIETELPQLVQIFLKDKPLFRLAGREPQDTQWELPLSDYMSMQLDNMSFNPKFSAFCKGVLLDGTAFAKVPYRYQEAVVSKRVQQQDPLTGEVYTTRQQELQVLFDGPDFEQIPFIDFFPDWNVKSPGNVKAMRGCAHRTWKTIADLKKTKRYKNIAELERSTRMKGCDAWARPYWEGEANDFDELNDNERGVKDTDLVEVWEYWGLWDPNNDGNFVEYILTIANGDVLLRSEENFYDAKFKPFVAAVNVLRDNEFYGIPELMAVRGPIKEATVLRNARLDQTNLAVNRMFIVDRSAGIKANNLFMRPNGIVWANDINGIKLMDVPESPASTERDLAALQYEIQNTTGMAAPGSGMSEVAKTFGRSATGAQMVQNMAASRIGMKALMIAELCVKPLAQIMMSTNSQFVSDPQWVRVSDPQLQQQNPWSLLPPDAFHCQYDFEILTPLDSNPAESMQNLQMFMQYAQAAEQSQPGTIKWSPVFEHIGRQLLGRKVRNFVRSDEERQAMMMQQLAGEQMINAQIGQAAPQPNSAGGSGTAI